MWQHVKKIVAAPCVALAWVLEQLLSRRGLAIGALVLSGVLAWGPWIRPPLSRDFRGTHIPWAVSVGNSIEPFEGREIPRPRLASGVGALLLVGISAGAALVVVWPAAMAWVFGGLLVISTCANAACLFNHPALIEFLDAEARQHGELSTLFRIHHEDLLTGNSLDRVTDMKDRTRRDDSTGEAGALWSAWRYQMFGPWVVGLAGLSLLTTTPGSWRRRMTIAAVAILVSVICAALVCWRRGVTEYHLSRASALEMEDQYLDAEQALKQALGTFPSMRETRRYWLTVGRLGYRLDKVNPQVTYFRAHQLMLDNELDAALGILQPLAAGQEQSRMVHDLMADIITQKALWAIRNANPSAAESLWREAFDYAPWQYVNWIGIGTAMSMTSPHQPERIEEMLMPRLHQVSDRLLRSDVASLIGDAYFRDGQFGKARDMYKLSISIFSLPKYVNAHAQEGMLGM